MSGWERCALTDHFVDGALESPNRGSTLVEPAPYPETGIPLDTAARAWTTRGPRAPSIQDRHVAVRRILAWLEPRDIDPRAGPWADVATGA